MSRHIVSSFSIPEEAKSIIEEFEKIARREGKSKSQILMELIIAHVKAHGEGNPSFRLDAWMKDSKMKALPTLGETNRRATLMHYDAASVREIRDAAEAWYRLAERELMRRG